MFFANDLNNILYIVLSNVDGAMLVSQQRHMKDNITAILTDQERMREQLSRFQSFLESNNPVIIIEESQSPEGVPAPLSNADFPALSVPLTPTPAESRSATGPAGQGQHTGAPSRPRRETGGPTSGVRKNHDLPMGGPRRQHYQDVRHPLNPPPDPSPPGPW